MRLPSTRDIIADKSWLRSSQDGRYLLMRGVCFGPSAKLPPHLPFRTAEDWARYETYVDLLFACGFRVLRLPFFWSAFEPRCNPDRPEYNEQYLRDFFDYVRRFSDKGFLLLIDIHQDLLGKAFGGNGMPEWVHAEGTRSHSFLKNTPLWGANYEFNRDLRKTFTDFWNNDLTNRTTTPPLEHFKVRDRFLDMVGRVAEEAALHERVLGIEIFNEPHPARINDRRFEEEILPGFYSEAIARIRRHSSALFAFVSPQSDWNVNLRENKNYESYLALDPATGPTDAGRVAFAYHYYDSLLTAMGGLLFHDAKREEYLAAQTLGTKRAREKGMVPFLTEFGTRQSWPRTIVRRHMDWQFEAVEYALVHSTYWNVNLYNTQELRDGFMREDFSLIGFDHRLRNLDIAVRPYVLAASAKPVHMHFNARTKEFELVLRGNPVPSPTTLYLPHLREHSMQPVHYERGFEIDYNGSLDYRAEGNDVELTLDPSVDVHEIRITPRS